jgi:hypothetical protein
MAFTPEQIQAQYRLTIEESLERLAELLSTKKEAWSATVSEFVTTRRAGGMSDEAIFRALREDLDNDGPIFTSLRSRVEQAFASSLEELGNEVQKTEWEIEFGDKLDEQDWMWVATLENSCPDCVENHGEVKTLKEWEEEGVPNIAPTICTLRSVCRCSLVPMEAMSAEDKQSVIEPVKLQKERIKEYARQVREEGRSLSADYRTSLIGQANNTDSIVR